MPRLRNALPAIILVGVVGLIAADLFFAFPRWTVPAALALLLLGALFAGRAFERPRSVDAPLSLEVAFPSGALLVTDDFNLTHYQRVSLPPGRYVATAHPNRGRFSTITLTTAHGASLAATPPISFFVSYNLLYLLDGSATTAPGVSASLQALAASPLAVPVLEPVRIAGQVRGLAIELADGNGEFRLQTSPNALTIVAA